jgi:hypothetical protein
LKIANCSWLLEDARQLVKLIGKARSLHRQSDDEFVPQRVERSNSMPEGRFNSDTGEAVVGESTARTKAGVLGINDAFEAGPGVFGRSSFEGVHGESGPGNGVVGVSQRDVGVLGVSTDGHGVRGITKSLVQPAIVGFVDGNGTGPEFLAEAPMVKECMGRQALCSMRR